MPMDYSKWDHIEVSDDEDDTHPNIDTGSLFRWRHQARVERMEEQKQAKDELYSEKSKFERRMGELQKKLGDASLEEEKAKIQVEMDELQRQEDEFRKKEAELEKQEKMTPWNVDTIGHDGFSKSRINTKDSNALIDNRTEDEKTRDMQEFVKKYASQLREYALLNKWDDSKTFLLENTHLCCEEAANFLVIECLNHEMEDKHSLMEHVAHQCIVMQYLLELAKQLEMSPKAPQLISSFFSKIKLADKLYMDTFNDELDQFKARIVARAKEKIEIAMREYEEEERKKRLGPGGLDPAEVFETLPKELQECFEKRDLEMLKEAMAALPEEEAKVHLQRCIDSGLWVEDASAAAAAAGDVEELKAEEEEQGETELRQRKGRTES